MLLSKKLVIATIILIAAIPRGAAAISIANFGFESGLEANMLTFGNTEVASEVAKDGIHLPCYEGSVCLRIAPGQGLRNHDAGIIITLADIQAGDVIEFEYVVIPQANNDFLGFSLTGPGFFDWRALLPIASWTHFAYTVPDLSGGGPSLMSLVSATEWTLMVWVENTVGDQNRTSLWLDDIGVQRRIPEPGTILLIAVGLIGLGSIRNYRKS
ncbi:MAG: PEP-CTERM sorting domain-containing protein [Candidatus Moranbacteria bacterium]|jgi:hypothetical protein|nr:PEP-CTERM sorting domain-containing protein [Candidatus Moranbacteria bacterium]MBP9801774.1 PEP-CTERM sorting domain-containing protein [Candidatus Moranbacteria bacterium]